MPAKSPEALARKSQGKKMRGDRNREKKIEALGGVPIELPNRPLTKSEVEDRTNVLFDLLYPKRHEKLESIKSKVKVKKRRATLTPKPWDKSVIASKKSFCSSKGIPFDLDQEWLEAQLESKTCPVLGVQFDWAGPTRHGSKPSIDRIDPKKGYTKDNCWVISWRANRIKSDASFEEIEKLYFALKAKNL